MPNTDIHCAWAVTTAPTEEPVLLEEVKDHARITDDASDGILGQFLLVAREEAEQYMGRGLLTQTVTAHFEDWACALPLPLASPLQNDAGASPSTAPVVQYYDEDDALQTASASLYTVDTMTRPGRIVLKPDQSWPTLSSDRRHGRVIVTYVVGWTGADLVPERIKQGIRQYVTYLELDRDGMEPRALDARQAAYRCWSDRISWVPPQR
jgi:uncharacterized phiE125 gp8 family phage protein